MTNVYHLMGILAWNALQIQEFFSVDSFRSGQITDYYVEASHWLHIVATKGAEIVLTPGTA